MKTGFKVIDGMTRNPVTMSPTKTLVECAKKMAKAHIGGMLVIDKGKLVGIISEQDIVRRCIAKGLNPNKLKIGDLMVTKMDTIGPNNDIYEALVKMKDGNIRHLPVMEKGKLAGLLTLKDILKIQPHLFQLIVEKFELREEENKPIYKFVDKEGMCDICGEFSSHLNQIDDMLVCDECKEKKKYKI